MPWIGRRFILNSNELIAEIRKDFFVTKIISGKEKSKILFLKHKELKKKVVLKVYPEKKEIYSFLKTVDFIHLPIVYETYTLDDGFAVLEEYIDGINVSEVMESAKYTYRGAKKVISDVCDALSILHDNGYVHRDIKPENIMISNNGIVKLIDFDVSRKLKPEVKKDTVVLGTLGYASPEQIGISQTGPATDIYAIGVLLNVMLTGKHPSEYLAKGKARKIILRSTQISPEKRFENVNKLKKAL